MHLLLLAATFASAIAQGPGPGPGPAPNPRPFPPAIGQAPHPRPGPNSPPSWAQAPRHRPAPYSPESPYGYGDWKPPMCKAVTAAVSWFDEQAAATSFCSSYLGIGTSQTVQTVSQTSTTTATLAPSTTTVTASAVTIDTPATSNPTIFVTSTVSSTITTIVSTVLTSTISACVVPPSTISTTSASTTTIVPNAKRQFVAPPTVPKPGCLQQHRPGNDLSSACRCFDITASTTTILTTTTSTITTTSMAVTVTTTMTPTVTLSTTDPVTSSITTTTTQTVTSTSTGSTAATVYARPTTPVQVFIQGVPGSYPGYNAHVLYFNGSQGSTSFIPRTGSYAIPPDEIYETLFEVSEVDETLRWQGEADDFSEFAAETAIYDNVLYIDFFSSLSDGQSLLTCTMTTDAETGYCPISCADGSYNVPDGNPDISYQGSLLFGFTEAGSADITYNLFGVPPPSS